MSVLWRCKTRGYGPLTPNPTRVAGDVPRLTGGEAAAAVCARAAAARLGADRRLGLAPAHWVSLCQ